MREGEQREREGERWSRVELSESSITYLAQVEAFGALQAFPLNASQHNPTETFHPRPSPVLAPSLPSSLVLSRPADYETSLEVAI